MLIKHRIPLCVATPMENKKFATSNGSAQKDQMISAWKKMDQSILYIPDYVKHDDIADAYFLSRFGEAYINGDIK